MTSPCHGGRSEIPDERGDALEVSLIVSGVFFETPVISAETQSAQKLNVLNIPPFTTKSLTSETGLVIFYLTQPNVYAADRSFYDGFRTFPQGIDPDPRNRRLVDCG